MILNVVDNSGNWNVRGVSGAIARKWPQPQQKYEANKMSGEDSALGDTQVIKVPSSEGGKCS